LGIAFQELETRLPRPLPDAARQDNDSEPFKVGVFAGRDSHRGREWSGMEKILRLRSGEVGVEIDQHNLGRHATQCERIRCATADKTASNDTDFHSLAPPSMRWETSG